MRAATSILIAVLIVVGLALAWWWSRAPSDSTAEGRPPVAQNGRPPVAVSAATPSITPPPVTAVPAAVPVPEFVTQVTDTLQPLPAREAQVHAAAAAPDALRRLTAVADSGTMVAPAAIEALADVPAGAGLPRIRQAVETGDLREGLAGIRALGRSRDASAVPTVAAMLERNRVRSDGFEPVVWEACAEALGSLADPAGVAVIARELAWLESQDCQFHTYGSQLVAAAVAIGRREAVPALTGYATALRARIPSEPRPKQFFLDCIAEIDAAITTLNHR